MSNNSRKVHMYIGPKIHDYMSISEKNGARSLAKYSIHRDFDTVDSFYSFCGNFYSERDLLDKVYYRRDDIHALCGEDLSELLGVRAYDDSGVGVPIFYGVKFQVSEEQKQENKRLIKQFKGFGNSSGSQSNEDEDENDNGKWRPY